MALNDEQVSKIRWRSKGRCEATWDGARCRNSGEHFHHRIPKSRGGRSLDINGDWHHLTYLCHGCHNAAHAYADGGGVHYDNEGLIVHGEIITWIDKSPYYRGPSETFTVMYPKPEGAL